MDDRVFPVGRGIHQLAIARAAGDTDLELLAQLAAALDAAKLDFTRIRRETNQYLSVDYVVFNTAVKAVEERDLALLNQWKEFLGSNPG